MLVQVEVVGVRIEMPSNQPIVLLKEIEGTRFLPIWVGAVEATSIAFAQQGLEAQRPLTHDLIRDLLERVDITLTSVHITSIKDGVFYADLLLRNGEGAIEPLSVRPSDAIAVALRTRATSWSAVNSLMRWVSISPSRSPTMFRLRGIRS